MLLCLGLKLSNTVCNNAQSAPPTGPGIAFHEHLDPCSIGQLSASVCDPAEHST